MQHIMYSPGKFDVIHSCLGATGVRFTINSKTKHTSHTQTKPAQNAGSRGKITLNNKSYCRNWLSQGDIQDFEVHVGGGNVAVRKVHRRLRTPSEFFG